jgi:hypothetical protein
MIKWIIDLIKSWLGHQLLADEEENERKRDDEIRRKRKEVIDADYSTEQTADDLDNGRF